MSGDGTVCKPCSHQFAIPPIEGAKGCFVVFDANYGLRDLHYCQVSLTVRRVQTGSLRKMGSVDACVGDKSGGYGTTYTDKEPSSNTPASRPSFLGELGEDPDNF